MWSHVKVIQILCLKKSTLIANIGMKIFITALFLKQPFKYGLFHKILDWFEWNLTWISININILLTVQFLCVCVGNLLLDQPIIPYLLSTLVLITCCLILYWYCKGKFSLGHSWELKGWSEWNLNWRFFLTLPNTTSFVLRSFVINKNVQIRSFCCSGIVGCSLPGPETRRDP